MINSRRILSVISYIRPFSLVHRDGVAGIKDDVGSLASYDTLIGHNSNEGIVMLPYIFTGHSWREGVTDTQYHNAIRDNSIKALMVDKKQLDNVTDAIIQFYNGSSVQLNSQSRELMNLIRATELIGEHI